MRTPKEWLAAFADCDTARTTITTTLSASDIAAIQRDAQGITANELAQLKAERDELREALANLLLAVSGADNDMPAKDKARAVLAKGKG